MAQTVSVLLNAADRERLDQIVGDRNRPLKHVLRAKIVLLSGDRLPVFAALDVLHGTVVGRCMPKHQHQEFIKFLNASNAPCPPAS